MKLKFIPYCLLGFLLVMLDVAFFSNFELFGASIVSSFLLLISLSISDRRDDYIYFGLILSVLLSIFSSLSIFLIALIFVFLPLAFNYLIKKYFRYPSPFIAIAYFIVATFVFEFLLLVSAHDWSAAGWLAVGYFVFLNSFAGTLINFLYQKIRKGYLLESEIKV